MHYLGDTLCKNLFSPEEPLAPCECSMAGEVPAAATTGYADPAGSCQPGSREQSHTPSAGHHTGTHNKSGRQWSTKGPGMETKAGCHTRTKAQGKERGQEAGQAELCSRRGVIHRTLMLHTLYV